MKKEYKVSEKTTDTVSLNLDIKVIEALKKLADEEGRSASKQANLFLKKSLGVNEK